MKKPKNQKTTKKDIFVSAVMVFRPEAGGVAEYVIGLFKVLNDAYTNYEIIIVDNGVAIEQLQSVTELLARLPCLRILKLSQNLKFDAALFAGLDVSIGDYVCTLDPEVDSAENVPRIIKDNLRNDVVQGVSMNHTNGLFGNQWGRKLFYWYNRKYIGIDIPLNATYHASYSRRAINSLTAQSGRHTRQVRHMARRIGFSYVTHAYEPIKNTTSRRRLRTGVIEALEIISSYSTHPLRFITWLGLAAGFVNVLYALYVLILFLTGADLEPGWTSTSMQLSSMFFILFLILTILSEYIGRILTETQRDPQYFIADELTSTVAIADINRKNTTN